MFPEYDVLVTELLTASREQFGFGGSDGAMRRQDLVHPRDLQESKHLRLSSAQCEIPTPRSADHDSGEQHADPDGIEEINAKEIDNNPGWVRALVHGAKELLARLGRGGQIEITDESDDDDLLELGDHGLDAHVIPCSTCRCMT
jgi:hypothetical protein